MVIYKKSYRLIAVVCITPKFIMIVCAVLDTGAGPNFVRRGDLLRNDLHISSELNQTTRDANFRPLNIVGTTALYVRFRSYVLKCHLYVCKRLATTYVLSGDFCDIFVDDMKPRKRLVELDYGAQVPIGRRSSNRDTNYVPIP